MLLQLHHVHLQRGVEQSVARDQDRHQLMPLALASRPRLPSGLKTKTPPKMLRVPPQASAVRLRARLAAVSVAACPTVKTPPESRSLLEPPLVVSLPLPARRTQMAFACRSELPELALPAALQAQLLPKE